jgi:hypothetical protein
MTFDPNCEGLFPKPIVMPDQELGLTPSTEMTQAKTPETDPVMMAVVGWWEATMRKVVPLAIL